MSLDAKTLGEEIIGAEIVASKELTEAAGGLFDALETAGSIWLQQSRWFVEDYGRFWLTSPGRIWSLAPACQLLKDRSEHIARGVREAGELLQRECTPLAGIRGGYLSTVLKDWQSA